MYMGGKFKYMGYGNGLVEVTYNMFEGIKMENLGTKDYKNGYFDKIEVRNILDGYKNKINNRLYNSYIYHRDIKNIKYNSQYVDFDKVYDKFVRININKEMNLSDIYLGVFIEFLSINNIFNDCKLLGVYDDIINSFLDDLCIFSDSVFLTYSFLFNEGVFDIGLKFIRIIIRDFLSNDVVVNSFEFQIKKFKSSCLSPYGLNSCDIRGYSKAHSISKGNILGKLSNNKNKVYLLKKRYLNFDDFKEPVITNWDKEDENGIIRNIGTVTTFKGLCNTHDGNLFNYIDEEHSLDEDIAIFLHSYRTVISTLFKYTRIIHCLNTLNGDKKLLKNIGEGNGIIESTLKNLFKSQVYELNNNIFKDIYEVKERFDNYYLKDKDENFSNFKGEFVSKVFEYDGMLKFCGCQYISFTRNGYKVPLVITILPDEFKSRIILTTFNDSIGGRMFMKDINMLSKSTINLILSNIIIVNFDELVLNIDGINTSNDLNLKHKLYSLFCCENNKVGLITDDYLEYKGVNLFNI